MSVLIVESPEPRVGDVTVQCRARAVAGESVTLGLDGRRTPTRFDPTRVTVRLGVSGISVTALILLPSLVLELVHRDVNVPGAKPRGPRCVHLSTLEYG